HVHAHYAIQAMKAGKPTYVEKPMATQYEDCVEMMRVSRETGVPLYVAYYRRALPNFLKIKEYIDQGVIGEIRAIDIRLYQPIDNEMIVKLDENWRVDPALAGGGYFYDLASHQFDLLDFIFGPIAEAKGMVNNQARLYKAEDIVIANFRFESGIMGTGSWCFTAGNQNSIDITTIVGGKGQIQYQTFGTEVVLAIDGREVEVSNFEMPKHIQQPLINTVVEYILGHGACPSYGASAARTNFIIDSILGKLD
ncbi:MAG: Gfo/Idh/MocA family oxidoreductase, partial [Cyclobacteriaceae bacterium]|nr:Gfo/Idh/MocA family oxidoreductase [Cyclobacteriaceae bacterium]